jgi:hypothetical protein
MSLSSNIFFGVQYYQQIYSSAASANGALTAVE